MAAAACILLIVWMGLGWDRATSRETYTGSKPDYYSLLVHGFTKGHLYMDVAADPRRESKDPAVRAKADYLLDASYFKGRYYLYFGVTPAALFLLPYSRVTGGDLDPRVLVVLFAVAGFLFALGVVRMATRDLRWRMGGLFQVAAAASLAFATAVPSLLARSMFYEVAIAGGYAFTCAGMFWTYRALFGRGKALVQLTLASLAFALAVGCRPDLLLNVPVVAVAAWLVAWRGRDKVPLPGALLHCAAAATAPAVIVGALLAAYNYERFGRLSEFGVSYSVNYFIGGDKPMFSASYLWPNLHWYYLTPPSLSPFFPYVFPEQAYFGPAAYRGGETISGQFIVMAMGAFVVAAALCSRRRLSLGPLRAYVGVLAWMFAAVLLAVSWIGFRGNRYLVDCQPALVLAIVLVAGSVESAADSGIASRFWTKGFSAFAAASVVFNIFAGLQEFEAFKNMRTSSFRALEAVGDYPAYWLEELGVLKGGPVELKVVFPRAPPVAGIEPLLSAGTPEYTDSLYVIEWSGGRQIELVGDHSGHSGPASEVISINPGQVYTLKIDMGALYPPLCPPFTARYRGRQLSLLKSGIRVEMDGKVVLDKKMDSYDAPPWSLQVGKNHLTMNPCRMDFSGKILSHARLPPTGLPDRLQTGLYRIRCELPVQLPNMSFPILSSGATGSGTLVYLGVLPDNRVRFGADEWSIGGGLSEALTPSSQPQHVIELLLGPMISVAAAQAQWGFSADEVRQLRRRLNIWMDGRLVWTTELRHPLDPLDPFFDLGTNHQGFSTAQPEFPGFFMIAPFGPAEAQEFLNRNLGGRIHAPLQ
jgi:hypothetical protein